MDDSNEKNLDPLDTTEGFPWIIKHSNGLIKNDRQALILILTSFVALVIVFFVLALNAEKISVSDKYKFDPTAPTFDAE